MNKQNYDTFEAWCAEYSRIYSIIFYVEYDPDSSFIVYFDSGWSPVDAFIEQAYRQAIDDECALNSLMEEVVHE
jgi:hypothetical protein